MSRPPQPPAKPIPPMDALMLARFWSRCDVRLPHECWPWRLSLDTRGYGRMRIGNYFYLAHRLSYTIVNGDVPPGLVLDHLCRNTRCVNPRHLEAVDTRTNIARGTCPSAAGARNRSKGLCAQGHVLAVVGVYSNGHGGTTCAQCSRDRSFRRFRRLAAERKAMTS